MNSVTCPNCSTLNSASNVFCISCGHNLAQAPPPEPLPNIPLRGPQPNRVEYLLRDLQDPDADTRRVAAQQLGLLKAPTPDILGALQRAAESDSNSGVRSAAGGALRNLRLLPPSPQYAPPRESRGSSAAPSTYSAGGYTALRGIASLCTLLGWIILGFAGLSAIGGLVAMTDSFFTGIAIIALSVFSGGFSFVILRVIAEGISVMLDIEANTRRAAAILERSLKRT